MGGLPIVLPDPSTFSGIAYDCFLRHVRDVILRKSIASFMSCDCDSDCERNPGVTCRMPELSRYFWLLPIITDTLSNRHPTGRHERKISVSLRRYFVSFWVYERIVGVNEWPGIGCDVSEEQAAYRMFKAPYIKTDIRVEEA